MKGDEGGDARKQSALLLFEWKRWLDTFEWDGIGKRKSRKGVKKVIEIMQAVEVLSQKRTFFKQLKVYKNNFYFISV